MKIVIVMDGGLIQDVFADAEIECLVVDFDTEGTSQDVRSVPLRDDEGNTHGSAEVLLWKEPVEVAPGYVNARFDDLDTAATVSYEDET